MTGWWRNFRGIWVIVNGVSAYNNGYENDDIAPRKKVRDLKRLMVSLRPLGFAGKTALLFSFFRFINLPGNDLPRVNFEGFIV